MEQFWTLLKSELIITIIIFYLLFIKISKGVNNNGLLVMIQFLLLLNFMAGFFFNQDGTLFGDMFYTNSTVVFQKNVLNLGVYLISLLFSGWLVQHEHMPEFFILMLSALLGMFFMISTNNILMFYLSLELATIPVAAIVSFCLDKKESSEAGMKMILSSAFSSGVLLFGISLLYGITGSVNFNEIAMLMNNQPLHIIVLVFIIAGFAFKLSVVPFHLWTADVYEGGPMPTTAFLSVISKGAMSFLFITALYKVFHNMNEVWYNMLMILAILTLSIGNLFALRQQNIKRFLAFSSIAQVGFILVAISGNTAPGPSSSSVMYFILIYIFSNLAAFGVAATIANQTGKERIDDFKGLYKTNPLLSWIMALALFSLAGIPPTAGFFGKLFLITAGGFKANYGFISFVALNLIVSLYYYLIIVRAMFMDKNEQPIEKINIHPATKLGMFICAAGILLTGLLSWIYEYIQSLTS